MCAWYVGELARTLAGSCRASPLPCGEGFRGRQASPRLWLSACSGRLTSGAAGPPPPAQASVALPAMDAEPKSLPKCYAPAVHWSDYFWSLCFDRWVRRSGRRRLQ